MEYVINLMFFLYFAVLFGERAQSLVRSCRGELLVTDGLSTYMYILTIASIALTVIFLIVKQRGMFIGLFTKSDAVYSTIDFGMLSIAAGCMLLSGMVHTEYSIPGIQFLAYGALVAAMALRTVEVAKLGNGALRWVEFAYVVCFSMAIPVVYRSQMANKTMFHGVEIVVSFVMVILFTIMLRQMFTGNYDSVQNIIILIVALVGDALVLGLRWKEHINSFVLIFVILAAVMWIVGKIVQSHTV